MVKPSPSLYDQERAALLPSNIYFGTSSWNYPGWQGSVYRDEYKNERDFKARSLSEYARIPWFRTLGIDSTFYGPPSPSTLARYHEQLPDSFCWVAKVWEEITIPSFPAHKRYGTKAGKENTNFLNFDLFASKFLSPFLTESFQHRTAAFVFQFQAFTAAQLEKKTDFFERLDSFFKSTPKNFRYAVEIRNAELLCDDYLSVLNQNGITHCFNHWSYMPSLRTQMTSVADLGGLNAPFYVARLLTPLHVSYQEAVRKFSPYQSLSAVNQEMRADTRILIKRALQRNVPAFILVNNRLEGYAPGTILALGEECIAENNAS